MRVNYNILHGGVTPGESSLRPPGSYGGENDARFGTNEEGGKKFTKHTCVLEIIRCSLPGYGMQPVGCLVKARISFLDQGTNVECQ